MREVIEQAPDRIAFYSYAHVPWTSRGQRLFDESDLPGAEEKILLYLKGKDLLLKNGYADIGMDHFSLPSDDLYKAKLSGTLHRNFMGYTTQQSGLLLGLGVSSISDSGNVFVQNEKTLHEYYAAINDGLFPVKKGFALNKEDEAFRKYILDISCRGRTHFRPCDLELLQQYTFPKLNDLEKDGLLTWNNSGVQLTAQGQYFIRNICSAFDLYLQRTKVSDKTFSKAI
jgi:oxygen-independent coproporphyrinogen-3 oxidase